MRYRLFVLGFAFVFAACGGSSDPAPTSTAPEGAVVVEVDDRGVEALQLDGVWFFRHAPAAGMDALHTGPAEIVDGCLYVDDAVVIWHVDQTDEVLQAISAIQAGEQLDVRVGGGGVSLTEGGEPSDLPAIVTDRCPTETVWFGSPS